MSPAEYVELQQLRREPSAMELVEIALTDPTKYTDRLDRRAALEAKAGASTPAQVNDRLNKMSPLALIEMGLAQG